MPVRLSLTFPDIELTSKDLEDLTAEVPKLGRGRIYGVMVAAKKLVTTYPSERPGQKYERTGNYGRSWDIEKLADGYRLLGHAVDPKGHDYTKYVAGNAYGYGQAWMHEGRWVMLRDAVEQSMQRLPEEVLEDAQMVSRRQAPNVELPG